METYKLKVNNYDLEIKMFNNKEHFVIPITLMTEGVRFGSGGPLLHVKEELEKFTESWNNTPIVINHPQNEEGTYVSANSPDILEKVEVGTIFNAYYKDGLKGEAWIDIEKLKLVDIDTYNMIQDRYILEISIGVYSDIEKSKGTFNDTEYVGISRNYRKDHVAILPKDEGACSIEDGCGLGVNKKGENKLDLSIYTKDTGYQITKDGKNILPCEFLSYVSKQGKYSISVNKLDYTDRLEGIRQKVYALEDSEKGVYYYVESVYDNYYVYKNSNIYYKQNYFINDDNEIELVGMPIQVKKDINYVPVNNIETNKGEDMAEKKDKPQVDEKVEETVVKEPVVNKADLKQEIMKELAEEIQSNEGMTRVFGAEVANNIRRGLETYKKAKEELVNHISENTKVYTKDDLANKELEELQQLDSFLQENKKSDYSILGGGDSKFAVNKGAEVEPMLPLGSEKKGDK